MLSSIAVTDAKAFLSTGNHHSLKHLATWLAGVTQRGAVPAALHTTGGSGQPSSETSPEREEEEEEVVELFIDELVR
ncbi:jg20271 [Pararge aegeria aegeria]|uniref:Jg20271 protein n=1 Tax=Pararge aegeria aegeria TaxID=348720 RepID=A0A8S4R574_9NEOP|nr:jg20271 [Pararge aegeria aegeria]